MFSPYASLLLGHSGEVTPQSLNERLEQMGRVLTGCGGLFHNGDEHAVNFQATALDNATDEHATLILDQNNAHTAAHALYVRRGTARFDGIVRFRKPIWGALRRATATADWVPATSMVQATDDETGEVIKDTSGVPGIVLFVNTAGKQPNVRSGAKVWYFYDVSGVPRALSEDDAIGSIRYVTSTSIIPGGWQVADGTGGTVNLIGRYPLGHATTAGTLSGSSTTGTSSASITLSGTTASESSHTHGAGTYVASSHDHGGATGSASPSISGSIDNASLSITGETAYATTGLTIDDPGHTHGVGTYATDTAADHTHSVSSMSMPAFMMGGVASAVVSVTSPTGAGGMHSHTISGNSANATTGINLQEPVTDGNAGHKHNINLSSVGSHTHSHTLTVSSHSHGISSSSPAVTGTSGSGSAHSHGVGTLAATDAGHSHSFTPLSVTLIPIQRVS